MRYVVFYNINRSQYYVHDLVQGCSMGDNYSSYYRSVAQQIADELNNQTEV